jgi:hypothetical protein
VCEPAPVERPHVESAEEPVVDDVPGHGRRDYDVTPAGRRPPDAIRP